MRELTLLSALRDNKCVEKASPKAVADLDKGLLKVVIISSYRIGMVFIVAGLVSILLNIILLYMLVYIYINCHKK